MNTITKARKTTFIRFIGGLALNGHQVEARQMRDGNIVLRHERNQKSSGLHAVITPEQYENDFDYMGTEVLIDALRFLQVEGF